MKKYLLTLIAATAAVVGSAQFLDDFESYTVGSYLGVVSSDWTTWSGTTGGVEDVQITNADAHSGSNSIYFSTSLATGGPQDVVLPFGGAYATGTLTFEMWTKVDPNKGGYLNFQSEVATGVTWALECFFIDDGSLVVVSDAVSVITGTYPTNAWFKVNWNINLDLNTWELLIDDVSKGSFSNTNNKIASLNLYPVNNQPGADTLAGYFVDDVSYEYTPPPSLINEPKLMNFAMSPNPASDVVVLNLSTESQPEITITDMMGRITYEVQPTFSGSKVTIPMDALASGVYMVSVRIGNSVSAAPLSVVR